MLIGQDSKKSVQKYKNCGNYAFFIGKILMQVDLSLMCALEKNRLVIIWTWGQSLSHRVGRKIQFLLKRKWTGKL